MGRRGTAEEGGGGELGGEGNLSPRAPPLYHGSRYVNTLGQLISHLHSIFWGKGGKYPPCPFNWPLFAGGGLVGHLPYRRRGGRGGDVRLTN